jgi:hypothetical protein
MKYIITERQYKLISEREEEILTIPYAHFEDWDMLQVFLKRRNNPPYRISGDLDLDESSIESLGNLESVSGNLYLDETSIKSLENLKSVGDDLYLDGSQIKSLGNLKSVGGDLYLRETPIESFGNLKSVGGNLFLYKTPISKKYTKEEIRSMVNVGGDVYL